MSKKQFDDVSNSESAEIAEQAFVDNLAAKPCSANHRAMFFVKDVTRIVPFLVKNTTNEGWGAGDWCVSANAFAYALGVTNMSQWRKDNLALPAWSDFNGGKMDEPAEEDAPLKPAPVPTTFYVEVAPLVLRDISTKGTMIRLVDALLIASKGRSKTAKDISDLGMFALAMVISGSSENLYGIGRDLQQLLMNMAKDRAEVEDPLLLPLFEGEFPIVPSFNQ